MLVKKKLRWPKPPQTPDKLFLSEGLAVGALIHAGIALVGADQNALQGAEICFVAVMGTLMNSALDALVGIAVHIIILLFAVMGLVWQSFANLYTCAFYNVVIDNSFFYNYNVCGKSRFSG